MHKRVRRLALCSLCCLIAICFPFCLSYAAALMASPGQLDVEQNGAAVYRMPLSVSPGSSGLEPTLSLTYNSQSGNGLLGTGWSVTGLSAIGRCPRTKVQDGVIGQVNYDMDDRYCLDGQRLILVSGVYGGDGAEYRTELESFSRIISYGVTGKGPAWFKVWTKSGQIMEYGNTPDSRIEAQGIPAVRVWALNRTADTKGNYFVVSYTEDGLNGDFYPNRIDYTGNANAGVAPNNSVRFQYEERPDITPIYLAGASIKNTVRLSRVQTYTDANLVKEYKLQYGVSPQTMRSLLMSVIECEGKTGACFAPTTFNWAYQEKGFSAQRWESNAGGYWEGQRWFVADANGDGLPDLINVFNERGFASVDVHINMRDRYQLARWETRSSGFDDKEYWFLADVNGDGLPDLLNIFNENGKSSIFVHINMKDRYQLVHWERRGGTFSDMGRWFVADVNGDGLPDVLHLFNDGGSASAEVHINTKGAFSVENWETKAGGYSDDQKWFLSDFNGDGLPDLINVFNDGGLASVDVHVNAGTRFQWTRKETRSGAFNSEQKWFAADVNGDGLSDLINVFNDGGYASIDVHMSDAIRFINDRWESKSGGFGMGQKWFVADVNGDNRPDLINIFDDNKFASIDVHRNKGKSFENSRWATQAGGFWDQQQWFLADSKGEGGAHPINVFNDRDTMSVDSHNVAAPADRIVGITNGLGGSSTLTYASMTNAAVYKKDTDAFYPLLDLQFPNYLVASVTTANGIGGVLTTRYNYGGMKTDVVGRGMLGMRFMQETQVESGLSTRTEYRQDWPFIGMPSLLKTTLASGGNGGVLSQTVNTYSCTNLVSSNCPNTIGQRYFAFVSQSVESKWDLNGAAFPTVTTQNTFDEFGNATKVVVFTSDGFSKTNTNTYLNDTRNWFLGRLTSSTVTSVTP